MKTNLLPIGIDFGSSTIRMAQLSRKREEYSLSACAAVEVPDDARHDFSQRLEYARQAVRQLRKDNGFKGNECVFCLPADSIFVQHVRIPKLPANQIARAVQKELPYPTQDTSVHHLVAGQIIEQDQPRLEVIVIAVAHSILNSYLDVIQHAHLEPLSIGIGALAIIESLCRKEIRICQPDKSLLFLDIGVSYTQIAIAHMRRVVFIRNLPIGCEMLSEPAGQSPVGGDFDMGDPLEILSSEIGQCLRYYKTYMRYPIGEALVLGGGAMVERYVQSLETNLRIPVRIGNPLEGIALPDECGALGPAPYPQWPIAVGLSMRTEWGDQSQAVMSEEGVVLEESFPAEPPAETHGTDDSDLPLYRLEDVEFDGEITRRLPLEYIQARQVLPIRREEEDIVVALADAADPFLVEDLQRRLREPVRLVRMSAEDVRQGIEKLYTESAESLGAEIADVSEDDVKVVRQRQVDTIDLEAIASESPVIRYVNYLISTASNNGASDIHIEPKEGHIRVRQRIDGMLLDQKSPPMSMHPAIISRLKIMAGLNIAERRLPQDGRIQVSIQGRDLDLRVSILPVAYGEKCVIRLLDSRSILVGLEDLGMTSDILNSFNKQVLRPNGIVLVTGPTGSGKTTTIYASMQMMNNDAVNVCTVEDPIEYRLTFANQVQVREDIGLTFASSLRSLLRQDPDVILVGEMRDLETARIGVQASLTGHLVLSTLHTNDAPSAITRLVDIGIPPFLIAASLNSVLAQRLVRKICEHCKEPVTQPTGPEIAFLEQNKNAVQTLYRGAGCDTCHQTGYSGRIGVYELLLMTDPLREIVTRGSELVEIRRTAREDHMRTLTEDAVRKVAEGITTVDETLRILQTV
jgi:type IV pilus assembly protein PilB